MASMSKYQDENGLWHDDAKCDSQNVYIYGAYAKALGLDVSKYPEYFKKCKKKVSRDEILIYRKENLPKPPLSFDECIGLIYLDLLNYDSLKGNHFVYYGHGERLDSRIFEKLAKAMLEMIIAQNLNIFMSKKKKAKQRNIWWERNLENVKYFAARLTPAHTYIVKKFFGKKYHKEEEKLWAFFRDCETKNKANSHGEYSRKNLLWLLHIMNGDEKRAKKLKPWLYFEKYFGSHHDFTKAIKKKYKI